MVFERQWGELVVTSVKVQSRYLPEVTDKNYKNLCHDSISLLFRTGYLQNKSIQDYRLSQLVRCRLL
jgi:hypothetical protein